VVLEQHYRPPQKLQEIFAITFVKLGNTWRWNDRVAAL